MRIIKHRFSLALLILLSTSALNCAGWVTVNKSPAKLLSILLVTQASLTEAHEVEWINDRDFALASDIINVAESSVRSTGLSEPTHQLILDIEAKLGPDHKLIPYLDLILNYFK